MGMLASYTTEVHSVIGMGTTRNSKQLDSNNNDGRSQIAVVLPHERYWLHTLTCKGCSSPLCAPVYYCANSPRLHLLCKHCKQCAVDGCRSKVSTSRSVIVEKILQLASFECEFRCKRGPFEGKEYKAHLSTCHFRPIACGLCKIHVEFRGYFGHLSVDHGIQQAELDVETLILNFALDQPRLQYVKFNGEIFLVHFESGKLWIEIWSEEENVEMDYRVRASGVKYQLDFEMQVLSTRDGMEMTRRREQPHPLGSGLNKYAIPPPDEELFLLFICDDDTNSISTYHGDDQDDRSITPTYV